MIQKKKILKREGKKKITSIFISLFSLIFVAISIFILVSSNLKLKKRRNEIWKRIEEVKKEIQRLEKDNQRLQAEISQRSSLEFLEREARERFDLKKPGEEVVVIVEPKKSFPSFSKKEKRNFWQKILDFFSRF